VALLAPAGGTPAAFIYWKGLWDRPLEDRPPACHYSTRTLPSLEMTTFRSALPRRSV